MLKGIILSLIWYTFNLILGAILLEEFIPDGFTVLEVFGLAMGFNCIAEFTRGLVAFIKGFLN